MMARWQSPVILLRRFSRRWEIVKTPDIVVGKEMRIITSITSYLQTNDEKEIKHYRSTSGNEPRTKWVFEKAPNGDYCIKNVGTGLYMMTPDRGVETWWDHCDADRGAWALDFTGVDDKRGVAWSIRSRHNGRYLCAYGDDDSRVNVNRDLADTWEHFTIVPV
eukprot:m51a1_g1043 hypothetical protein (163) ;mRNA; f:737780-738327